MLGLSREVCQGMSMFGCAIQRVVCWCVDGVRGMVWFRLPDSNFRGPIRRLHCYSPHGATLTNQAPLSYNFPRKVLQ